MENNSRIEEITARIEERMKNDPVLSKLTELKESDLIRVINGSYIAERFFNRSRAWFNQKINHSIVNGKPADFTAEERKTLANALRTLSFELDELADELE